MLRGHITPPLFAAGAAEFRRRLPFFILLYYLILILSFSLRHISVAIAATFIIWFITTRYADILA